MEIFRRCVQKVATLLPMILWLTTLSAQSLITTVAGRARPILGASGAPATSFPLDDPCAVAADSNGNVYFTDIGYNMVFRISNGTVYPFAGTGAPQSGPTGGKAVQTAIESPWAIATDAGGNVYFTEFEGLTRVLRVDTTGAITTVGGGGTNALQFSSFTFGDGGPASRADFFEPYGVAVDPSGNVFVANQSGNRISKISSAGIISSLIGILQVPGFSGDGGPAQLALMNLPQGLAADKQGNLYFADRNNNRIRKIAANGVITTVAGNGQTGFSGDQGPATEASMALPAAVAVDGSGNLLIADRFNNVIRRVDGKGIITTIAGNLTGGFNGEQGNALTLSLYQPNSVAVDNNSNVYIVDTKNRRIRMITPAGVMKTIAGNGQSFFSGDGGPAINADLDHPSSAKFDNAGSMYVADSDNQRIRKITADGTISTIAGNGSVGYSGDNGRALDAELNGPADVAVDAGGQVYIADTLNNCIRLVGVNGVISTFAGTGRLGYSGDGGAATLAELDQPTGIVLAPNGDLVIADRNNNRVRRVNSSGIITTIVGNGVQSYGGDGGPAVEASINWPAAVAFNANGELLIAATQERRIRKVDGQGIISTIAGAGSGDWSPQQDFIPATQVDLDTPTAIAVDPVGNIFTNGTNQIQRINPGGILTILVNLEAEGAWGSSGDGGPGVLAPLSTDNLGATTITHHLAIGPDGGLYIADANRIRKLASPSTPAQISLSSLFVFPAANFSGDFSGPAPVTINNLGTGAMNWTATVQTLSGGDWLSVTPGFGAAGDTLSVEGVQGIFNTLPPGYYRGNVFIDAPDASNSFMSIQIEANVGAPAVHPPQGVGGTSLGLVAGSLAVMTGQFVQTLGQNMVAENEASWQLGGVSVAVNGVYAPVISLTNVDGTQQVVFQVPAEAGIGQATAQVAALNGTASAGFTTAPLTVTQPPGAPPASIAATAGSNQSATVGTAFPVSLQAAVLDFAGKPAPGVTVTFSASSSGANGAFAGRALTATAVTNNAGIATAPAFSANGTPGGPYGVMATVSGATAPAVFSLTNLSLPTAPVISAVENSATGHLASPAYGIASNSFISIYSSNIGTVSNPNLFPATDFQGLQVLFNGAPAPLYAVTPSANQINVVVPSELPGSGTATIRVQNSSGLSQGITLVLAQDSVGVFRIPDSSHPNNGAVVLNGTTWLVMPASTAASYGFQPCTGKPAVAVCAQPAKPGDNIAIYFTGGGLATPNGNPSGSPVPTGSLAPVSGNPLYQTVETPTITIGGLSAPVQFSGIAPGTAAEYQLNTQIPLGVQLGDNVPVVMKFANSSDTVTIAVQSP